MSVSSKFDDKFAQELLDSVPDNPKTGPRAYFIEEGDCIEFLFSDESYHAVRLDSLLTVYYGYDSGELVGSLIKGVSKFIKSNIKAHPALVIDFEDGNVSLSHLFYLGILNEKDISEDNQPRILSYKRLRDEAAKSNVSVKMDAVTA